MFQEALALRQAYFLIKTKVVLSDCHDYKPASSSIHVLLVLNLEIQPELHMYRKKMIPRHFTHHVWRR